MGIRHNNRCTCTYCMDKIDFIEHFLVDCPQISAIWIHIQNIVNNEQNLKIVLHPVDILFGFEERQGMMK